MKKLLLVSLLLAGSTVFAAHLSIGVNFGPPPPPPRVAYVAAPGPGYVWVGGYYYPVRRTWQWRPGYWTRPPYEGAYWAAPYYYDGRYFAGRWEGNRGYIAHDHRWDRTRERDEGRGRDRDHDRRRNERDRGEGGR